MALSSGELRSSPSISATRAMVDTSPEAEAVQRDLLREKSPGARVAIAIRLTSEVVQATRRAIRRVSCGASEGEMADSVLLD